MTIWQKITNNFKNGNMAKFMTKIGQATFTAGATGAMFHQMTNNSCCQDSIFGNFGYGNYCNNYNIFNTGCCNNSRFNPYNPYAKPLGFGTPDYSMMQYAMNTQYGNQLAWNDGFMHRMQDNLALQQQQAQQIQQSTLPKLNTEYAGDIDKNQSREQGKAFETTSNEMVKDNKPVEGKSFKIIDGFNASEDDAAAKYKNAVSELGKSYLAEIDASAGNEDGKLTLDEYIKYELNNLGTNATEQEKAERKLKAQVAFNKIDQNGDGKADWKELAAVFATLDAGNNSKKDAEITAEEYAKATEKIALSNDFTFDKAVRNSYKQLFFNKKK